MLKPLVSKLQWNVSRHDVFWLPKLGLIFVIFTLSFTSKATTENIKRKYSYSEAARYTHLKWYQTNQPVTFELLPINNFSGIPIEARDEAADYFDHGKIPQEVANLFADLLISSRQFSYDRKKPDYHFQLTIESYQHPYPYAPDNHWWEKASSNLDRSFTTATPAVVELSLTVSGVNAPMKMWRDTVEMTLTHCDLNALPQTRTTRNNENETLDKYVSTVTGQAFLAASNFLITKAIERIHQESSFATVSFKSGNEITVESNDQKFLSGETLAVHYSDEKGKITARTFGQVKVIEAMGDTALVYPVSVRADHLRVGDKVAIKRKIKFDQPKSIYQSTGQCAAVEVATR